MLPGKVTRAEWHQSFSLDETYKFKTPTAKTIPALNNDLKFFLLQPSVRARSYLDRVLEELTLILLCPTFHYAVWTGHWLVRVSLWLTNSPSLAGYWKFNTSLQEIADFRDRLESLLQWALVGAVTGNKW